MNWDGVMPGVSVFATNFLVAIAPVLASLAAAWMIKQYQLARGKLTTEQLYWLDLVAQFAVTAAEQAEAGKLITDKKNYAFGIAQQRLAQIGLKVDLASIDAAIERAVWIEINRYKPMTTVG